MKDFAVPANLLNVSKCLGNRLFKKFYNSVFWHPCQCILVTNFSNFSLEEVLLKISDLVAG